MSRPADPTRAPPSPDAEFGVAGLRAALRAQRRDAPARFLLIALVSLIGATLIDWRLCAGFAVLASTVYAVTLALNHRALTRRGAFRRLGRWAPFTAFLCNCAYVSLAIPLWSDGGKAGMAMSVIMTAGGIAHATLRAAISPPLWRAGVSPYIAVAAALPLIEMARTPDIATVGVSAGILVFLTHFSILAREHKRIWSESRARLVAAYRARLAAQEAAEAKTAFLEVMSHEVRTPAHAIATAAHLIRDADVAPRSRRHLDVLRDAMAGLSGLLDELTDFADIEAERFRVEARDFPLRERIESFSAGWAARARAKGLAFTLEIAADAPERVRGDPGRLQQILGNLLANAVSFTDTGGIALSVNWRAPGRLEILLSDSGFRLETEMVERVFQSFDRVDPDAARRLGGVGLSLAISRRVAEKMGGSLTAEPGATRGAVFRLALPMEAVAMAHAPEPEPDPVSGLSLLVADDNLMNREVLRALLEQLGCTVALAEDGQQAVDAARDHRFDAILLDMQMPVMDGLEAAHHIRAGGANRDTPILVVTAQTQESLRTAWAGIASAYLTKPVAPRTLNEALASATRPGRPGGAR